VLSGASLHSPRWPGTAQLWQSPSQALSQQTPSTQGTSLPSAAFAQGAVDEQMAPIERWVQLPSLPAIAQVAVASQVSEQHT
jgi:hypothetical protein